MDRRAFVKLCLGAIAAPSLKAENLPSCSSTIDGGWPLGGTATFHNWSAPATRTTTTAWLHGKTYVSWWIKNRNGYWIYKCVPVDEFSGF